MPKLRSTLSSVHDVGGTTSGGIDSMHGHHGFADTTTASVLGSSITVSTMERALIEIRRWANERVSSYVCFCNVHAVTTAREDAGLHEAIEAADLALPDGAPIAWSLRQQGFQQQRRVNGPDLMLQCLANAERDGAIVSFYGDTTDTLAKLRAVLLRKYPDLRIGKMISPPFRQLSDEEDAAYIAEINAAGTNVLFVGLGCPKQEQWMMTHRGQIDSVMLGVGAAFAYHAGVLKRAPKWMQTHGLEWMHRMMTEPRRLTKRYLRTNAVFLWISARQQAKSRLTFNASSADRQT